MLPTVMITLLDLSVLLLEETCALTWRYLLNINKASIPMPKVYHLMSKHNLMTGIWNFFQLFLKHQDKIPRVTLWGIADHHSWKNN